MDVRARTYMRAFQQRCCFFAVTSVTRRMKDAEITGRIKDEMIVKRKVKTRISFSHSIEFRARNY